MSKIILLMIFISFSFPAFAVDKAVFAKMGVLDIQVLTSKTKNLAEAKAKLRKEYSTESEALKLERRALRDEIDKYNASSDKLKPDELTKWQQKINILQVDLEQRQTELQKKLIVAENFEANEIINYFSENVDKIAEKNNFDLVFFKDVIPYSKNNSKVKDITSMVVDLSKKK